MTSIYTVNANGSSPVVLLSVLLKHRITHVFDVRRGHNSVFSRCRGDILERLLSRAGITYRLVPDLMPSQNLSRLAKRIMEEAGPDQLAQRYLDEIGSHGFRLACDLVSRSSASCFVGATWARGTEEYSWPAILAQIVAENMPDNARVQHLEGRSFFGEEIKQLELHKGKHHNLLESFQGINIEYFDDRYSFEDVHIVWEEMPLETRRFRILAYFRYPSLLAFNPVLDQENIPWNVINAAMHHEMTHMRRAHEGLPAGHTPDFYEDEALFRHYAKMFRFDFSQAWGTLLEGEHNDT